MKKSFHWFILTLFLANFSLGIQAFSATPDYYTTHLIALQKYQAKDAAGAMETLKPLLASGDDRLPPRLFWNAGTFAFKNGDFVAASVYWEAAMRGGLWNLEGPKWIRDARKNFIHSSQNMEPDSTSDLFAGFVPWSWGFGFFLSGILLALAVWFPRARPLGLIFGFLFGAIAILQATLPPKQVAFAFKDDVNLLARNEDNSPVIATIKKGDRLTVERVEGPWVFLNTHQGARLWAKTESFILVR